MKMKNSNPIRALWIYEGASGVQKVIIARSVLSTVEH
jgi:hypothetical protein